MTKSKKVVKTGEIRAEDFMKQMLAKAESLESEVVIHNLAKYLEKHPEKQYFLLLSHEARYYQVFRNKTGLSKEEFAKEIYRFFEDDSVFYVTENEKRIMKYMTDIREIEDSEGVSGLDMWFSTTYFQLMPFDWGVETF